MDDEHRLQQEKIADDQQTRTPHPHSTYSGVAYIYYQPQQKQQVTRTADLFIVS